MKKSVLMALAISSTLVGPAIAKEALEVTVNKISETGVAESLGTVNLEKHDKGVLITPNLTGLQPGLHGFHVHQNPDCGPGEKDGKKQAGLAAGGHYDPKSTGEHNGPFHDGHHGDLPALFVDEQGNANHPVLAPRLSLDELKGRSLMIHQGGDNYSDSPQALGGGGARVACGVIGQK